MATNFPTSLDALTNPTSSDSLNSPSHSAQHANVNDAVEALEAKVGANSSAVTTSHDYKIAQLEALSQVTILSDTITVNTGTNTTPTFTTELIDVGGWHTSGSAYIVAPYDGIYLITANVVSIDSGTRALVNISNSTAGTILASHDNNGGGYDLSAAVHADLSASDNIGLIIYQNSGATKTPVVTFSMELVRRA